MSIEELDLHAMKQHTIIKKLKTNFILIALCAILLTTHPVPLEAGVIKLISKCECRLTIYDIYSIFMFRKRINGLGELITVVINKDKLTMSKFLHEKLHISIKKYNRILSTADSRSYRIIYTNNDTETIEAVRSKRGSIGYINNSIIYTNIEGVYNVHVY